MIVLAIIAIYIGIGIGVAVHFATKERATCPDCGREDWNNDKEHGYNRSYDHCIWCGYCTYHLKYTGKRNHNDV